VTDVRGLPLPVLGPLDGADSTGKPWIGGGAIATVRTRLNQEAPAQKPATPPTRANARPTRPGG
jgi:hypothetical protein